MNNPSPAGCLELAVHRHHSELVGEAGLQAAHHDGVLVQLVLGLDPLRLLLLPADREFIKYQELIRKL